MGLVNRTNNEPRRLTIGKRVYWSWVLYSGIHSLWASALLCSALYFWPQTPAALLDSLSLHFPAGFLNWETSARVESGSKGEACYFPITVLDNSLNSCISHDSTSHQAGQPWSSFSLPSDWTHGSPLVPPTASC